MVMQEMMDCELFGAEPVEEETEDHCPQSAVHQPDELHDAHPPIAPLHQEPLVAARCVNGTLVRPGNAEADQPSILHVNKVKYVHQEEFHWEEVLQDNLRVQEVEEAETSTLHHHRRHHPLQFRMRLPLQVQQLIHYSGHL